MPELFKLEKEEFAEQERRWTYLCLFSFIFNEEIIKKITITDRWQRKSGRELITKELILNFITKELNNRKAKPTNYPGERKVFIRERFYYQGKKYRLVFWFKDGTTNHLWIRNCYPID
jgi:hypothetical protein